MNIIKAYILSILLLLLANLYLYGQEYNKYCLYTDYSVRAYEKEDYKTAIALMDTAINHCQEENNTAVNWYNLSLYYRAYYKKTREQSIKQKILETTLKAQELDKSNELKSQIKSTFIALANAVKREINYYANDTSGVLLAQVMNKYKEYKFIYRLGEPDKNFISEDVLVYNILGSRYEVKYRNNKDQYIAYLDSSILYYKKSIKIDSTQSDIYKTIGTIYFNQAADIINALDYDADLQTVMESDSKKADLAMKGLPYFEKALEKEPNNGEVIYALAGCYKILNFEEKYQVCLDMLKEKDPEYYNSVYTED